MAHDLSAGQVRWLVSTLLSGSAATGSKGVWSGATRWPSDVLAPVSRDASRLRRAVLCQRDPRLCRQLSRRLVHVFMHVVDGHPVRRRQGIGCSTQHGLNRHDNCQCRRGDRCCTPQSSTNTATTRASGNEHSLLATGPPRLQTGCELRRARQRCNANGTAVILKAWDPFAATSLARSHLGGPLCSK